MERRVRLEVIDVVEPCTEDWSAMRGDERVRFCGLCHQNVFDLSAMAREEAERLVAEHEGRLCVRFYRRADGTVSTADCAPDRLAALRRGARRSLAGAAAATAGLMALVGGLGLATAFGGVAAWLDEPESPDVMPVMGAAPIPEEVQPLPEPPEDAPGDVDDEQTSEQTVSPIQTSE